MVIVRAQVVLPLGDLHVLLVANLAVEGTRLLFQRRCNRLLPVELALALPLAVIILECDELGHGRFAVLGGLLGSLIEHTKIGYVGKIGSVCNKWDKIWA